MQITGEAFAVQVHQFYFIEVQKLIVSLPEVESSRSLFEVLGFEAYTQGFEIDWFLFKFEFGLF